MSTSRNPHTRRVYARAVADLLTRCTDQGVGPIADGRPLHVAAWVGLQMLAHAALIAKLRLVASGSLSQPGRLVTMACVAPID